MDIRATTDSPLDTGADTIVVGIFDGKGIPHDLEDGALGALVESGEARSKLRSLTHTHAAGRRWILVGCGSRDEFDGERARVVAAVALGRAQELGAKTLCWELPHKVDDSVAGALVEGTLLAAYRYTEFKTEPGEDRAPDALIVSAHHDIAAPVAVGRAVGTAANRARDLGNAPPNALKPAALADRARAILGVQVDVMGRAEIEAAGMGAFASIAQGADAEPQLITIRYDGGGDGPLLGFVGKAVTFDSGGYSIKPAARMHEMKFDMG